ncbi:unnamed protein product [Calypogeia fissa]
MKILVVFTILFLVASAHTDESWKHGYKTTFFDSFIGAGGSLPSSSNWLIDLGTSYPGGAANWGTAEVETCTSHRSNLAITKKNTLAIVPRLSRHGNWTSARIETVRTDFVCSEGGKLFIEAKIRLGNASESQMQGIWPAFWALGSKFRGNYTNWPMVSEWDFLESINGLPRMYTTVHCGYAPGGPCNEYSGIGSHTNFTKGEWHKVGFEVDRSMNGEWGNGTWLNETLRWKLDDQLVFTVSGAMVGDEQAWMELAHEPHFILLNVAVGGSFPNGIAGMPTPTNATIGGKNVGMEVDYVGVWNSH